MTIRILAFLEPELILCSFTPLQYLHHSQFQYNNILKYLFKMNLWPQIEVTHYHSHLNNQRDIPAANHPNCHDIFIISSIFAARQSLPKLTGNNKNIWAITENKTINCKNIYCVLGLASGWPGARHLLLSLPTSCPGLAWLMAGVLSCPKLLLRLLQSLFLLKSEKSVVELRLTLDSA